MVPPKLDPGVPSRLVKAEPRNYTKVSNECSQRQSMVEPQDGSFNSFVNAIIDIIATSLL
jgi:hypothetical protein